MSQTLRDWVIVTGAGGALGAAIARDQVERGRSVLALDRDAARLDALPDSVQKMALDLTDQSAIDAALTQAIPKGERIATLINAVGLIWNEPLIALKGVRFAPHAQASFESVIAANLTASFLAATSVAMRMMRSGGGAILNFSSISARGQAGQVAYSAAKAGIEGMTRAMADELGPVGIRVNAVAPGFIDVPTTREAVKEAVLAAYIAKTPLRRLGSVQDLLDAIEAINNNVFLNGQIVALDGGLRL